MPLHDFRCKRCNLEFEDLHNADTQTTLCPLCRSEASMVPICQLADYTGQASRTVQYTTRRAPKSMQDSHLTKLSTDTTFLRKQIGKQRVN